MYYFIFLPRDFIFPCTYFLCVCVCIYTFTLILISYGLTRVLITVISMPGHSSPAPARFTVKNKTRAVSAVDSSIDERRRDDDRY